MRRPSRSLGKAALALAGGAALVCARPARAQAQTGFALDTFDPSERGSDWFTQDSLDLHGHLRFAAGLVGDFAYRPLVLYNLDGTLGASLVRDQYVAHTGASVVLWDRARFGLNLPIAVYEAGLTEVARGVAFFAPHGASLGDLRLSGDARILGEEGGLATLAGGAELFLPTGARSQYMSDGTVRVTPRLQVAGDVGPFTYAARVGIAVRPHQAQVEDTGLGTQLVLGAAAGARLWQERLVLGPELVAATVLGRSPDAFTVNNTPVELLLGGHVRLPADLVAGLGVAPGLVRGIGEPLVRVVASIEWAPGKRRPATQGEPAPREPPPAPAPEPDADKDGIPDALDACPTLPGPPTQDPASRGCPGGLPPAPPRPPEPKVLDRDHDGVPDALDACPDDPGPARPDPATNGCPLAFVQGGKIRLAAPILFTENTADLDPASEPALLAVRAVLEAHPDITRLRIEGHTDDQGSFDNNLVVSKRRAKVVLDWLVAHGIAPERLQSQGYASAMPIADNKTPEGRGKNRRIELHVVPSQ